MGHLVCVRRPERSGSESFAMLDELLLPDRLYRTETGPLRKTFFLERFLQQAMYDGAESGRLKTPGDFGNLTKELGDRYSIRYAGVAKLVSDTIVVLDKRIKMLQSPYAAH